MRQTTTKKFTFKKGRFYIYINPFNSQRNFGYWLNLCEKL